MIQAMDFNEREKNLIVKGLMLYLNELQSGCGCCNFTDLYSASDVELLKLKNKIETFYTVSKTINHSTKHLIATTAKN